MATAKWDPNPNRGKVPFLDRFTTAAALLLGAPVTLLQVVWRRALYGSRLAFMTDLGRSFVRYASTYVPLSVKRKLLTVGNKQFILGSTRFKPYSDFICKEVYEKEFVGYWVCRGLANPRSPKDCDLVVLYMFGGAFVLGHGLLAATSQLRMCEIAEEHGISLAIFAVDYSLAPEATFPKQQDQIIAAYKYLLEHENIEPSRVVVSGQSAGGWLALSALEAVSTQKLPQPGAAWLFYPWTDLTNSGASFERHQYLDTLVKPSLNHAAKLFVANNQSAVKDWAKFKNLQSILPNYTWVTVGEYDCFYDSIHAFVEAAQKNGANVDIIDYAEGVHGFDASLDRVDQKAYLSLKPGIDPGKLMPGAKHMANGIIQIYKSLKV